MPTSLGLGLGLPYIRYDGELCYYLLDSNSDWLVDSVGDFIISCPPPPISCAYPLNCDEAEVILSGYTARLLLSNSDQTASRTFTADDVAVLDSVTYQYAALAAGWTAALWSTPNKVNLQANTGKKAVEFHLVLPAIGNAGTGDPFAYQVSLSNDLFGIEIIAGSNGKYQYSVYSYVGDGAASIGGTTSNITLVEAPTKIGLVFDTGSGSVVVRVNDVLIPPTTGVFGFTPGDYSLGPVVIYPNSSLSEPDIGKTVSVTLVTSAADMTGTYSAGETDPCGTVI